MKVIIIRKFTTNKILCIYLQSSIFKKLHVGWSCFHNFSVLLAFKSINMTYISGNAWLFWLLTDRYLAEVKTLRTLKLCLFFKLHLTYFVKWDKIQWVTFICIIQPNTLMSTWRINWASSNKGKTWIVSHTYRWIASPASSPLSWSPLCLACTWQTLFYPLPLLEPSCSHVMEMTLKSGPRSDRDINVKDEH